MFSVQAPDSAPFGFLSTHNALADALDGASDELITLRISELNNERSPIIKVSVYPFYDVELLKRLVINRFLLPPSTNISELRIFLRGTELPNHRNLLCFAEAKTKLHFFWSLRDASKSIGIRSLNLRPPHHLQSILADVNLGMHRGIAPKLTMDGTGGTYFMSNSVGYCVALFKPRDEEAFAPNNPRAYEGQFGQKGFRPGVYSGEGAVREVAAYIFDAHHGNHAGVPVTTKVEARHSAFCHKVLIRNFEIKEQSLRSPKTFWKEGSFQECIQAHETCGDYDPRVFAVSDVHNIGILDISLLNLDRNDGNILVTQRSVSLSNDSPTLDGKPSRFRLIPIDHGLILPDTMDVGDIDLVWYDWPQSNVPFTEKTLRYLFSFDEEKDVQRLRRKLDLRENCLRSMKTAIRVLLTGAKMHLNLRQIASLLVRTGDFQQPSISEKAVHIALGQAYSFVNASILGSQCPSNNGGVVMDLHLSNVLFSLKSTSNSAKVTFSTSDKVSQECEQTQLESETTDKDTNGQASSRFFRSAKLRKASEENNSCSSDSWDDSPSLSSLGDRDAAKESKNPPVDSSKTQDQIKSQLTIDKGTKVSDTARTTPVPFGRTTMSSGSTTKRRNPLNTGNEIETNRGSTATTRRLATALRRRTATTGAMEHSGCTWTLFWKNGRPCTLPWDNPALEKIFFECFDFLINKAINEHHPAWKAYTYHGQSLSEKNSCS